MNNFIITCCGPAIIKRKGFVARVQDVRWVTLLPCKHDLFIQVIPVDDLKVHRQRGGDCWCEPRIEIRSGIRVSIHEAKDGRA